METRIRDELDGLTLVNCRQKSFFFVILYAFLYGYCKKNLCMNKMKVLYMRKGIMIHETYFTFK